MTRPSKRQLISVAVLLFFGGLGGLVTYYQNTPLSSEDAHLQISADSAVALFKERSRCDRQESMIIRRNACGAEYEIHGCRKTEVIDARLEYFTQKFRDTHDCDSRVYAKISFQEHGCRYSMTGCEEAEVYQGGVASAVNRNQSSILGVFVASLGRTWRGLFTKKKKFEPSDSTQICTF